MTRKRGLWFYRYRFTKRGEWFVLLKPTDPAWEHVRRELRILRRRCPNCGHPKRAHIWRPFVGHPCQHCDCKGVGR